MMFSQITNKDYLLVDVFTDIDSDVGKICPNDKRFKMLKLIGNDYKDMNIGEKRPFTGTTHLYRFD